MNVVGATGSCEEWLASPTCIDETDLHCKHAGTEAERFPFLRAAYYCWEKPGPQVCPDLAEARQVPAAGSALQVVRPGCKLGNKKACA